MTEKEYRALKRRSVSQLKMLADPTKTPAHFKAALNSPFKVTDAMRIGTATHLASLEPIEFAAQVASLPFDGFTTKAARAARDEALEREMIPLLSKDYDRVLIYRDNILANPEAKKLLDRSDKEKVILWECEGVELKSKLDICETIELPEELGGNFGIVSDEKTCMDASSDATNRAMLKYGYCVQAGAYSLAYEHETGYPCNDFYFIWIEKPSALVVVRRVEEETLQLGKDLFRYCCRTYKAMNDAGVFPAYPSHEEQALTEWDKRKCFELLNK